MILAGSADRPMQDYHTFKHTAIRYWERRRIIYNLLLIPPSFFAYMLTAGVMYVGDPHDTLYGFLLFWFTLSALGANAAYSLVYALEFLIDNDDPTSTWLCSGRRAVFVCGLILSMVLALVGGRNIAIMEYAEQSKRPIKGTKPYSQHAASPDFYALILVDRGKEFTVS
jgi:hypothetical protein